MSSKQEKPCTTAKAVETMLEAALDEDHAAFGKACDSLDKLTKAQEKAVDAETEAHLAKIDGRKPSPKP